MTYFFFGSLKGSDGSDGQSTEGGSARLDALKRQHPEFMDSRSKRSDEDYGKHSGFDPGDKVRWKGDPGEVKHSEFDKHTGVTTNVVHRKGGGTYESRWRQTGRRTMTIVEARRITS